MRARCKVSFGCRICLVSFFAVSFSLCFLSGCHSALDYVFAGFGWGKGGGAAAVSLPSPTAHSIQVLRHPPSSHHLLPRPDSLILSKHTWMVLYCHPYHPLILKHRDVLVNPGWAGALSFRNILYTTGNQRTAAPRSSRPRVSRLGCKAEICQRLICVGTVAAGGGR